MAQIKGMRTISDGIHKGYGRILSDKIQRVRSDMEQRMEILLLRHGMTGGNLQKRYIGITDEPLCTEGREQLRRDHGGQGAVFARRNALRVFTSPLLRCRQTAELLFPKAEQVLIPELQEMNFGIFENRAFAGDLEFSPEYQSWLDGWCEGPIPGGEQKNAFTERCILGFRKVLQLAAPSERKQLAAPSETEQGAAAFSSETEQRAAAFSKAAQDSDAAAHFQGKPAIILVAHGGTIMSIMDRFGPSEKKYYEWNPGNGHGYLGYWDGESIVDIQEI